VNTVAWAVAAFGGFLIANTPVGYGLALAVYALGGAWMWMEFRSYSRKRERLT